MKTLAKKFVDTHFAGSTSLVIDAGRDFEFVLKGAHRLRECSVYMSRVTHAVKYKFMNSSSIILMRDSWGFGVAGSKYNCTCRQSNSPVRNCDTCTME